MKNLRRGQTNQMAVKTDIEKIKLLISSMMNEEQDNYSKLIIELRNAIGKTREFEDTAKILAQIYEAKLAILEKIYKELQNV